MTHDELRKTFKWKSYLNKNGDLREEIQEKLLKDLDTDHIIQILIYFTEKIIPEKHNISESWKEYHLIFLNELKYRWENKI